MTPPCSWASLEGLYFSLLLSHGLWWSDSAWYSCHLSQSQLFWWNSNFFLSTFLTVGSPVSTDGFHFIFAGGGYEYFGLAPGFGSLAWCFRTGVGTALRHCVVDGSAWLSCRSLTVKGYSVAHLEDMWVLSEGELCLVDFDHAYIFYEHIWDFVAFYFWYPCYYYFYILIVLKIILPHTLPSKPLKVQKFPAELPKCCFWWTPLTFGIFQHK